MQLGAFTPFLRVHSAKPPLAVGRREPWAFGPEAEALARAAIELRHALLPYTYTAFWRHRETGLPVMRALALHWPDDPRASGCGDAFLGATRSSSLPSSWAERAAAPPTCPPASGSTTGAPSGCGA